MRMLWVIITGLTLLFFITMAWYFSQEIVVSILSATFAGLSGDAQNTASLIQFCSIVWGPFFDVIVVLWMVASAQARDIESQLY